GVPSATNKPPPGNPIQAPDPGGNPPGTASVVLDQQFFDTVLTTIFRDMNAPAFPLGFAGQNFGETNPGPQRIAYFQNECDGRIVLLPEGSGVKTGVRLENGR